MSPLRRRTAALAVPAMLAVLGGCGGSDDPGSGKAPAGTVTAATRVEVVESSGGGLGFEPRAVYKKVAPGVVTVVSIFSSGLSDGGQGTGFVISSSGEIATNAHVVTSGTGGNLRRASEVVVVFEDGNRVPARIVGFDPNADIALLRIDPDGLTLRPLPLGSSSELEVGSPVAAIGSPFGEPQSLSVGVISAVDRTIESLTSFSIPGAIQTDAAINHGNSGGPLVDADGAVIGVSAQIESTGGGGEGVGFAVPIDLAKRSLAQLRATGKARYAFLGISSVPIFPQLATRFDLPVKRGAWIQEVTEDGPAEKAGLRGGGGTQRFQSVPYAQGGDIITKVGGTLIVEESDVSIVIGRYRPGPKIPLEIWRDGKRRTVTVTLGERPASQRR
jgi:S1-C subfamily serine protease